MHGRKRQGVRQAGGGKIGKSLLSFEQTAVQERASLCERLCRRLIFFVTAGILGLLS